jgi:uncharacterized caspase-like protein
MPPVGVGASRFASALETGEAKLWVLLIGVNHYDDETLPPLRYAALDCQGLGEALTEATQAFPQKEFLIHHDLAPAKPTLAAIQASLQRLITEAKAQDTVLTYFSGHGILDANSHQTVLCVADTQKQNPLGTGLCLQDVLLKLGECDAHSQIVWLDACHSGNITLSGAKGAKGQTADPALLNPTPQLLELLRQRAAKSRGFYALLSCDQGQQSWEFPDLGHGVFSYYLMRGLRGEAAGPQGVIDADGLYRYVYHQTLQYVEQTNQQLRLVNQQKRNKGDTNFHSEYSLQTPKRIVEGVGETILGLKPKTANFWQERQALLIDGLPDHPLSAALEEVLQQDGNFELERFPPSDRPGFDCSWLEVRTTIARFLQSDPALSDLRPSAVMQQIATRLLYLRGTIATSAEGESWLVLGDGVQISRAWLRQELRRSRIAQQIVILDCPGAIDLEDWLEELKIASEYGQCILACASPADDPDLFAQVLLEALIAANPQTGLPVASLLAKLQTNLEGLGLPCHLWLSGTQGLIEVLPSMVGTSLPSSDREATPLNMGAVVPVKEFEASVDVPLVDASPLDAGSSIDLPIDLMAINAESEISALVDRLTPILLSLIGPVAPALIAQAAAQVDHPQQLVEKILPLLPASKCSAFEQQAHSLIQLGARSKTEKPTQNTPQAREVPSIVVDVLDNHHLSSLPNSETVLSVKAAHTQNGTWSSAHLAVVEHVLLELVGPITSVLLTQIPPQTNSVSALVAALSGHLSPQQCAKLEQQLSALIPQEVAQNTLESTVTRTLDPSHKLEQLPKGKGRGIATAPGRQTIDEGFIQTCEYELTRLIGPIAKWIVDGQRGAKETAQMSSREFVDVLAANIPDDRKAAEFRQRLLK